MTALEKFPCRGRFLHTGRYRREPSFSSLHQNHRGHGDSPNSSDGVVPYWSSHLNGAESEHIVPSGHGAHQNPQAIAEVLRILKANALAPGVQATGGAIDPLCSAFP